MDIQKTLTEFIETKLAFDREPARIAADAPLLGGFLDSLDILRLVSFIEEQFQIRVQDDELIPENFQTVRTIEQYIRGKSAAGA